ncbi:zona pellucida sperm-binding protein 3-like [Ranitomeya variabilis]|uniref:zona pellucida sperm-binding protein 3-like n=1 Tax=Ranitomeya variabilis TaxID=490064 RepID=UPI004055F81E
MEQSTWLRWLIMVLLCGPVLSESWVRHRRQSDAWWRNYHPGQGSSRGLGQPISGVGSSRGDLRFQPVSGWDSRYYGQPSSRQLSQPPSSPINVQCGEDRMVVSVNRDFYGNGNLLKPSDLRLGSCSPGSQVVDPMVVFDNDVQACGSNLQVSPEFLIYRNVLNYNPVSPSSVIVRSNPAAVPIVCFYPRHGNVSSKAVMPTWAPFTTTVSTEERLVFSMYLMTDDWSERRPSSVFQLGDIFTIEAWVETENHMDLILFVDYCVATITSDITADPRYDIISSNGCLVDGTQEDSSSAFISPRSQSNRIQFMVDAFRFIETPASTVYITCSLRATKVDQTPDPMNKACSYNKASRSWSALEGSNNICRCCESRDCGALLGQTRRWGSVQGGSRGKREIGPHPEEHSMATLGPILVIGAEHSHQASITEHLQALEVPEESQSFELWILVAIGSVSLVVIVVALVFIGRCVVKRLSPRRRSVK